MNTATEQMKNDLRRDPEDLAREADGAREHLEGTVDELMHQLAPGELLNQGISFIRSKGDFDFIRNLTRQVENNPIPTVLITVSLIWLMTASKQASSGSEASSGESLTDRISKKAGATRDKLSSASSRLGSSSHSAADRTRETGGKMAAGASDTIHRVSDASRNTAQRARSGLRNASEGTTQMFREHPLLIGALAVAAGAALGTMVARTSAEDRVMGDLSDRGTEALKEKAEEKMHEEQENASGKHTDATGAQQPNGKAPQLDPAKPEAAQEASKTHPGT